MSRHMVFVYGTLKIGQPNHNVLTNPENGQSQFVGKAQTVDAWPLVITSRYNIPFLLHKQNFGKKICGEIYSVDDKMLSKMDEFESHPSYYTRLQTLVELEDGTPSVVWVYFVNSYKPQLLELPTLHDYSSYGEHGLRYVESEQTSTLDDMND